jgi:hypothetical protein
MERPTERAIEYIENNNLQKKLEQQTIDMWREVENKFKTIRKTKER